jgi:tetratricopeptide (TPR) repeat protein
VLDLLAALVNKSLVLLEDTAAAPRYRLLETVRQYARERLDEAGETAQAGNQHLAWCLALGEQAEPALLGPEQNVWLARLEAEHDNLRAALRWAGERGLGDVALHLASALWRFWSIRGYMSEGRQLLEQALANKEDAAPLARARALNAAGNLARSQGDYYQAATLHSQALALRRELGDKQGIASSLSNLGVVTCMQGDQARGTALFSESLALQRELGDKPGMANSLTNLGNVVYRQGDYARAAALHQESLLLWRELGNKKGIANSLINLGMVVYRQGDHAREAALQQESLALQRELGDKPGIANSLNNLGMEAQMRGDAMRAGALFEESLALQRELGDKPGIANSLNNLGMVARMQGHYDQAMALVREALSLGHIIGEVELVAEALENLAGLAVARGHPEWAARLGGAAEILREAVGMPLPPEQRVGHDQALAAMRAVLGEESFAATWAEGRALPLNEAVALALEGTEAVQHGQ